MGRDDALCVTSRSLAEMYTFVKTHTCKTLRTLNTQSFLTIKTAEWPWYTASTPQRNNITFLVMAVLALPLTGRRSRGALGDSQSKCP